MLQCGTTGTFFLGRWPRWRRLPQPGGRGEFDVDDDVRASTLTADAREQMVNDFGEAKPFVGLANFGQVRTAAGNPPPALVALGVALWFALLLEALRDDLDQPAAVWARGAVIAVVVGILLFELVRVGVSLVRHVRKEDSRGA